MRRSILPVIFALLLILIAAVYFLQPHRFHGTQIQSPEPSYNFTLNSSAGEVSLEDFRGKLVLLYFGYTFCPDVCPATLANVSQALLRMGEKARDFQLVMISLDPQRDSPQVLADYVAHFDPSFIGVTGTEAQVKETANRYGIYFQKHEGSLATGYLIDHTATLLVIDRQGHLTLSFPFGATINEIASDLEYLTKK